MSIWDDVLSSKDEIEGWANSSLPQLAEHISDLNNSRGAEEFLKEFEVTDNACMWRLGYITMQNERKKWVFLSPFCFSKTQMNVTNIT